MANFHPPLKAATSEEWASVVLSDFPRFLQDHASCERKAAALAMSFVAKYPNRPALIEPMVSLAREELEHFAQVFRVLQTRGIPLAPCDERDGYIRGILDKLRHGRDERLLDRLIMSGLVEARGYERFAILADALQDPELKTFYRALSEREAGHYKIFITVARKTFEATAVDEAIERIAAQEAEAMLNAPLRPTLH